MKPDEIPICGTTLTDVTIIRTGRIFKRWHSYERTFTCDRAFGHDGKHHDLATGKLWRLLSDDREATA